MKNKVNRKLKCVSGSLAVAAVAVVIGCGGGGTSSTPPAATTTGGNRTGQSVAVVSMPNTGATLDTAFLSGQGRAAGDILAHISRVEYLGPNGNAETRLADGINVLLNGYTANHITLDTPISASQNSETFNQFHLQVDYLEQENPDGSFTSPITGPTGFAVDELFDSSVTAFPGRTTSLQVYLDDATITLVNGVPTFNRNLFLQNNTTSGNPNVTGFLSDYVMFDISNDPTKVTLNDGSTANRIYFSGDRIAISTNAPVSPGFITSTSQGEFEVFDPVENIIGNYSESGPASGVTTGPPGSGGLKFPGTYTLKAPNPLDLSGTALITSLAGTWRPVGQVISSLGPFEVILLPHTSDSNQQDAVAFTEDSTGHVTSLYYGVADLTADTISLFPLTDLASGATTGEIDGTLSALEDNTSTTVTIPQSVRQGTYTLKGTLPTGFTSTGRFIVFRI